MSGAVPLAPPASFFTRLLRSPVCVSGTLPVDVQLLIHPPFWFTTNTHPYRWATFIDQQILITNTLSHYLAYILLLTAYCLLLVHVVCVVVCDMWCVLCVVSGGSLTRRRWLPRLRPRGAPDGMDEGTTSTIIIVILTRHYFHHPLADILS